MTSWEVTKCDPIETECLKCMTPIYTNTWPNKTHKQKKDLHVHHQRIAKNYFRWVLHYTSRGNHSTYYTGNYYTWHEKWGLSSNKHQLLITQRHFLTDINVWKLISLLKSSLMTWRNRKSDTEIGSDFSLDTDPGECLCVLCNGGSQICRVVRVVGGRQLMVGLAQRLKYNPVLTYILNKQGVKQTKTYVVYIRWRRKSRFLLTPCIISWKIEGNVKLAPNNHVTVITIQN